jgi:hypothetical protein
MKGEDGLVVVGILVGALVLELGIPAAKGAIGPHVDPVVLVIVLPLLGTGFAFIAAATPELKVKQTASARDRRGLAGTVLALLCWMTAGAWVGVPVEHAPSATMGAIFGGVACAFAIALASKVAGVEKGKLPPPPVRLAITRLLGVAALIGGIATLFLRG